MPTATGEKDIASHQRRDKLGPQPVRQWQPTGVVDFREKGCIDFRSMLGITRSQMAGPSTK